MGSFAERGNLFGSVGIFGDLLCVRQNSQMLGTIG